MEAFKKKFKDGVYVGDFVYGANDGIITTFAVVAGATGALLSPGIIVILGLANLFADSFSMGASNFLALRAENEVERAKEHGHTKVPLQHGIITFVAFIIAGFFPLIPYFFALDFQIQFLVSSVLAACMFFAVGAGRTFLTGGSLLKAGGEMLLVGGVAAGVAYFIGLAVKSAFGIVV